VPAVRASDVISLTFEVRLATVGPRSPPASCRQSVAALIPRGPPHACTVQGAPDGEIMSQIRIHGRRHVSEPRRALSPASAFPAEPTAPAGDSLPEDEGPAAWARAPASARGSPSAVALARSLVLQGLRVVPRDIVLRGSRARAAPSSEYGRSTLTENSGLRRGHRGISDASHGSPRTISMSQRRLPYRSMRPAGVSMRRASSIPPPPDVARSGRWGPRIESWPALVTLGMATPSPGSSCSSRSCAGQ